MKPDNQVYEAAVKLRNDEMKPFVEWLRAEREAAKEFLTTAPEAIVSAVQGKAQFIAVVLELIEDAPAILDKRGQKWSVFNRSRP